MGERGIERKSKSDVGWNMSRARMGVRYQRREKIRHGGIRAGVRGYCQVCQLNGINEGKNGGE